MGCSHVHLQRAACGQWAVLSLCDSHEEDEYESIDVQLGKRAGVIGLPQEENVLI